MIQYSKDVTQSVHSLQCSSLMMANKLLFDQSSKLFKEEAHSRMAFEKSKLLVTVMRKREQ